MMSNPFRRSVPSGLVAQQDALPGRSRPAYAIPERNAVLAAPLLGPWPPGVEEIYLGMGCFWGAEELYWSVPGVVGSSVGYLGGFTTFPTYEEVCTGRTGHAEVVCVAYRSAQVSTLEILRIFWEHHDPTQGNRQGNDIGTQYRSAIYFNSEDQRIAAEATRDAYQSQLSAAGFGEITTEIAPLTDYFYAEPYHQQYLGKNPNGYCGIGGTGVSCPVGIL